MRRGPSATACTLGFGVALLAGLVEPVGGQSRPASDGAEQQPASSPAATWLRVTAERVDIRSRPDANSVAVTRVDRDTVLRAVEQDAYGWYRIEPPTGVFSYVSAEHVERQSATDGAVTVRSGSLRVRVGSTLRDVDPMQNEVQMLLPRGAAVRIVGEQGGWLKIAPPEGVSVYVHQEAVTPISAEVAERLRGTSAAEPRAPASDSRSAAAPAVAATRPAEGPDLSGAWGQRLVLVEAAIEAEGRRPLYEQSWTEPLARLRPIAEQREEPMVARLAEAWSGRIEQRISERDTVRLAEEALRRAERDRALHERESERLAQARQQAASQPAFVARGLLLQSYAVASDGGKRYYKLIDPLTGKLEAYLELGPDAKLDADRFVNQYVGVRGRRSAHPAFGADLVAPDEIVALQRETPASAPARQER